VTTQSLSTTSGSTTSETTTSADGGESISWKYAAAIGASLIIQIIGLGFDEILALIFYN
jgi:hypothetical protein